MTDRTVPLDESSKETLQAVPVAPVAPVAPGRPVEIATIGSVMLIRGMTKFMGCFLLLCAGSALAQEPVAIFEIGGAPGFNITNASWSMSPTLAVETTPIERWLELEFGVTPTFGHRSTEWDTDLLFKKPWELTKKVEFMFGVGPVWIHTRDNGVATNSIGGEVALDFMFWPSSKRRFGWYLEPAYQYNFGGSHEKSIGVSIGLLIAIR